MTNISPHAECPQQTSSPTTTTAGPAPRHTPVIHDRNGTWFSVSGLWVSALTDEELADLEAGDEHILRAVPGINLLDIVPPALSDQDTEFGT